ncbi:hypothetical protein K9L97_05985 [Candidatus Woesearchaeota archaeon]|nr:hypothetical protein [Candidatus Woesearchaeota archaeon]
MVYQNKKILVGIALTIIFLTIFILTNQILRMPPNNETTTDELRDGDLNNTIRTQDDKRNALNFERAIEYNNNYYCQFISVEELKNECYDRVSDYEEPIVDERTAQQKKDDLNYERAIEYQLRTYCNYILNEELKQKCISETPEPETQNTEIETQNTEPQPSPRDQLNYERAIEYQEPNYCNYIRNIELQTKCKEEVQ